MTIRCDLHIHSHHSYDSMLSAKAIVRAALRRRLDVIAVTDHESIQGGLETRAVAPPELLVIVGAEIYTDVGDIVCLFLQSEIRSRKALEVIAETHAQGGVAFLPHPLRSHPPSIADDVLEACDGYEVLNSRAGWFQPVSRPGKATRWELLAAKAPLGNSDAHLASEIGRGATLMPGPATADNVRRRLLDRHTEVTGEPGPAINFYRSQLIKLAKTRDLRMLVRLAKRVARTLRRGSNRTQ